MRQYIEHLEMGKEKRMECAQRKRLQISEKKFDDYDWKYLFEQNLIEKQTVLTLQKYIDHFQIGSFRYKWEKANAVRRHIAVKLAIPDAGLSNDEADDVVLESYDDSESEEDENGSEFESGSEDDCTEVEGTESENENENENRSPLVLHSRRTERLPSRFRDFSLV